METIMKISNDALGAKINAALRLRVGFGKTYSFEGLEEVTGIKARTLRSYVDGTTPPAENLMALCAALGPGFTSDVFSLIGQTAASANAGEPQHMPTLCASTGFASMLAEALNDGHISHREKAAMQPAARELRALLEPIAEPQAPAPADIRRAS